MEWLLVRLNMYDSVHTYSYFAPLPEENLR